MHILQIYYSSNNADYCYMKYMPFRGIYFIGKKTTVAIMPTFSENELFIYWYILKNDCTEYIYIYILNIYLYIEKWLHGS